MTLKVDIDTENKHILTNIEKNIQYKRQKHYAITENIWSMASGHTAALSSMEDGAKTINDIFSRTLAKLFQLTLA
jgi:hypothetical protein